MKTMLITIVLLLLSTNVFARDGEFGLGLYVTTKGFFSPKLETVVVSEIIDGQSAHREGVVVGDDILSIDGCTIPGCSAKKAQNIMKKDVGESILITIRTTDGKTKEIELVAE